ncbi:MAG: hypothetical protein JWN74_1261 [Acidobacteriaceae bacterium]|nr:hypothetical protein [Acidobacteriaceae bacterium]
MSTSATQSAVIENPLSDERWQLVHRILASPPFQKSGRLRDLLQYITAQTIAGYAHELTEQHIGEAVFGKRPGYSPLDDSSVRVHARQLRLRLHEYFDGVGRDELLIVEIPKGSYAPTFRIARVVEAAPVATPVVASIQPRVNRTLLPWVLCGVLTVFCVQLSTAPGSPAHAAAPPWPFPQIFDTRHQTVIVVADGNYGMFRILTGERGSLPQYLQRDFPQSAAVLKLGKAGSRFADYISNSTLTSFADVANAVSLVKIAGPLQKQVSVRSARDLRIRDLDHENYIFVGSPASNPWVSLFQDKLNFRESESAVGNSAKAFVNKNPLPGEQAQYEGLRWTGTEGDDYATIALLPNITQDGSVLILQGLQQEGTEAAGRFLADADNRHQLQRALGIPVLDSVAGNVWFEALIRSRTVSGAPNSSTLVSVRRIR